MQVSSYLYAAIREEYLLYLLGEDMATGAVAKQDCSRRALALR
jgi:hypothetical protein